jgi:transcriptional regulator with XRE-family HTH domain
MTIKMTEDQDWMRRMAELEADCCVSAGGLPATLGMLRPPAEQPQHQPTTFDTRRVALARFVEFSRRKLNLTVDEFSQRAGVDAAEVLQMEDSDALAPEPRVIFAIAAFLRSDATKLMELAGHIRSRDERLGQEAVRFAAWTQGAEPLSRDEERFLGEFARVVVSASEGGVDLLSNFALSEHTALEIDQRVAKVLADLDNPEPPLDLDEHCQQQTITPIDLTTLKVESKRAKRGRGPYFNVNDVVDPLQTKQ